MVPESQLQVPTYSILCRGRTVQLPPLHTLVITVFRLILMFNPSRGTSMSRPRHSYVSLQE